MNEVISTKGIGNGTMNPRGDIVTKDIRVRRVKARRVKPQHVLAEVKAALKHKEPMMIAIARKKK